MDALVNSATFALLKGFLRAVLVTAVSLWAAQIVFPFNMMFATAALIAVGLGGVLDEYLEENRVAIWETKESSYGANARLGLQIAALFFGVLFTGLLALNATVLDEFASKAGSSATQAGALIPLFRENLAFLMGALVISIIYRSGGLMIVLSLQAFTWIEKCSGGVSIPAFFSYSLLELVAFVLAGMSGIFISKAIVKYSAFSEQMNQVARACVVIFIIALGSLFASSFLEITFS